MALASSFDDGSLRLDGSLLASHVANSAVDKLMPDVERVVKTIQECSGEGSDFLGWLDPSEMIQGEELDRIKKTSLRLREKTDLLVVIGIGGSYLGARACYDALRPNIQKPGELVFAGTNMSARYHRDILHSLLGRAWAINVISKSGTTTEPGISFRLLRKALEDKLESDASGNIVATTDANKGALRTLADEKRWETFVVPDDVGGRYSVLTPVGLFPLAYAGVDIDALIGGAGECAIACREKNIERNPALFYAIARHLLYKSGLAMEILCSFEPRLEQLIEWWKQLYGESEGKDHSGLFPSGLIFSRDLHSLGQWVQDGPRVHFETFLGIENGEPSLTVPEIGEGGSLDGLDYLAGRELSEINAVAQEATRLAHADGGCPNMGLYLQKMDAYHLGVLIYFFEYACAVSGYLNGINPFNQPGVEVYKRRMFELLGKPKS